MDMIVSPIQEKMMILGDIWTLDRFFIKRLDNSPFASPLNKKKEELSNSDLSPHFLVLNSISPSRHNEVQSSTSKKLDFDSEMAVTVVPSVEGNEGDKDANHEKNDVDLPSVTVSLEPVASEAKENNNNVEDAEEVVKNSNVSSEVEEKEKTGLVSSEQPVDPPPVENEEEKDNNDDNLVAPSVPSEEERSEGKMEDDDRQRASPPSLEVMNSGEGEKWTCKVCTLENRASYLVCEVCQTQREITNESGLSLFENVDIPVLEFISGQSIFDTFQSEECQSLVFDNLLSVNDRMQLFPCPRNREKRMTERNQLWSSLRLVCSKWRRLADDRVSFTFKLLCRCGSYGSTYLASLLVSKFMQKKKDSEQMLQCLKSSILNGKVEVLKILIEGGSWNEEYLRHLVIYSIRANNLESFRFFVEERNAEITKEDLDLARIKTNRKFINYIVEKKGKDFVQDPRPKRTPEKNRTVYFSPSKKIKREIKAEIKMEALSPQKD
eukprot:TRINITY_DN6444_c0_g1_i1.p1 TRINITY_DN6444_c0_g1~~TRINITY_DN6444_c0_g1_i1.p1  ORF type:complete len:570 (-),score=205.90 TRINITY_DN6444_c0_g1_i1:1506-2987(-)